MLIFHTAERLQHYLSAKDIRQKTRGFVPTMGALHAGHSSLLQVARKEADLVIASIFVNPTQFNDKRDFENYPTTLPSDLTKLIDAGCDLLFLPSVAEIYPAGYGLQEPYQLGYLETVLEGQYRPGHFQGVCQVVDRLLTIVQPDVLFLGQKDYQQCMVLEHLIRSEPALQRIQLHICPTLREKDGLAMSSRNMRLTAEQRSKAPLIFQVLQQLKQNLEPGNLAERKEKASAFLSSNGFRVDYVEFAHAQTLEIMNEWNGKDPMVALTAAFLGDIRLIDNIILTDGRNCSAESV